MRNKIWQLCPSLHTANTPVTCTILNFLLISEGGDESDNQKWVFKLPSWIPLSTQLTQVSPGQRRSCSFENHCFKACSTPWGSGSSHLLVFPTGKVREAPGNCCFKVGRWWKASWTCCFKWYLKRDGGRALLTRLGLLCPLFPSGSAWSGGSWKRCFCRPIWLAAKKAGGPMQEA